MTERKNIYWINAVKAIAMLAVYLTHVQSGAFYGCSIGIINSFIRPWYVNLFFFISGYLLFRKQLSVPLIEESRSMYMSKKGGGTSSFVNIICRIILPSILFASIEFVPNDMIRGRGTDLSYAIYKTLGGGTYWFTSALAVAEVIIIWLFLTRIKTIWFYLAAAFLIAGTGMVCQHGSSHTEVWAYHRGIIATFLLACGGLYWKFEKDITKWMKWYVVLLLLVSYCLIVLFVDNNNPSISNLQPWGAVSSILSCVLVVELCKHIPESRVLSYIGKNTLGFYFMSGALPAVLTPVVLHIVPDKHWYIMLIEWMSCIGLACLIVMFINRWLPWMFDFKRLFFRYFCCFVATDLLICWW